MLLLIGSLGLGTVACGGQAKSASSAGRALTSSTSSLRAAAGRQPRHAVADYDTDDYEAGGDADDDDSAGRTDRDGDTDNPTGGAYDEDDVGLFNYGHPATPAQARDIAAVLRPYFVAAATSNGARACAMMVPRIARALPETVGGVGGPPYARGRNCAEVTSRIFRFYRNQLSAEARALRVARVGVGGAHAMAVLAFPTIPGFPERIIRLEREGGAWKVEGVTDNELP